MQQFLCLLILTIALLVFELGSNDLISYEKLLPTTNVLSSESEDRKYGLRGARATSRRELLREVRMWTARKSVALCWYLFRRLLQSNFARKLRFVNKV